MSKKVELLEALMLMAMQYCCGADGEGPIYHRCMVAGEQCERVLGQEGMLHEDGSLNWEALEKRKTEEDE